MRLPLIVSLLALAAVAGTGLVVTDFTAYLGSDPTTCNNCHVMDYAYEGWYHAPHSRWAVCGDCHTPHALIPKYISKAASGARHVTVFLLDRTPPAIRAIESSRRIIQENCLRCHAETVANVPDGQVDSGRYCFECHRDVAHGERGISILPYQEGAK